MAGYLDAYPVCLLVPVPDLVHGYVSIDVDHHGGLVGHIRHSRHAPHLGVITVKVNKSILFIEQ